jgi:hypothetical protein
MDARDLQMIVPNILRLMSTLVRAASVVAVLFVVAGLIGFLTDEVRDSSKVSATRLSALNGTTGQTITVDITQPNPPSYIERAREKKHTGGREFIDDVGDVVLSPFTWVADGSKAWVQRLVDSGLALLIYGVLGLFVADRIRRLGDRYRRDVIGAADAKAAAERRESGTYVSPA